MTKTYQYVEGEQASRNFEKAMKKIFKAPKGNKAARASEKSSEDRERKSESDKD